MVNVMAGGAVLNIMFYIESAFSVLPVAASSGLWVKGSSLNRLALDLRSEGFFVVNAVVLTEPSADDVENMVGTL